MLTSNITYQSNNQNIILPISYKIDDSTVYVKQIGNALLLLPYHNPWQTLFNSLNQFTDGFMQERMQSE